MAAFFRGFGDAIGSVYRYVTGEELAQEVVGRNRRAAENTENARLNWERNAEARGRAMVNMERTAEDELRRAGVPIIGRPRAASRRRGSYVEARYTADNGSQRLAHFSAHPVGGPGSKIGPFHGKVETAGQPTYEARAVPRFYRDHEAHPNLPTFGNEYVGIRPTNPRNASRPPAPPVRSHAPEVLKALGHGYSYGLEQHVLERNRRNQRGQRGQPYRGYGGDKRRKTNKRKHSRKSHTRRR
jgi:hypothetical protein